VTLLTKVSAAAEREWYAAQVIHYGWSRPTLHEAVERDIEDALIRHIARRASHSFDIVRLEANKLIDACEGALALFKPGVRRSLFSSQVLEIRRAVWRRTRLRR
jgi:hypothetical protein